MNLRHWFLGMVGVLFSISTVWGDIVFSQDFAASSSVSSYVNLSNPDSGQWNAIQSASILSGALKFTRGSAIESFTRSTDFAPTPEALIYRFDLSVSGPTSKTTAAAVWQVGSGFTTANRAEVAARVHSQFAVNFTASDASYSFRDPVTGTDYTQTSFSGQFPITWAINNSGAPIEYTLPNGTIRTVGTDQWDLWLGSYRIFSGRSATTPGQALTDLKFAYTAGSGTILMDNFSIEAIPAVPEPAATSVFAAAFLALFALASKIRTRVRHPIRHSSRI